MTSGDRAHLLEMVSAASTTFETARAALHGAVHAALADGATWSDIGDVLGVSRQAAFQRFGPKQPRDERPASDHLEHRLVGQSEEPR